jgi:hypothetical protein
MELKQPLDTSAVMAIMWNVIPCSSRDVIDVLKEYGASIFRAEEFPSTLKMAASKHL